MIALRPGNIFRTLLFILLILINFQGFSQTDNFVFIPENKINKEQIRELFKNDIIHKYDRILAIYKLNTDDVNKLGGLQIEKFSVLTNDKIIDFIKAE